MVKYLFHSDELKRGIQPHECGLKYLSCRRIEINKKDPCVTLKTGDEEVALVNIHGTFTYTFRTTDGISNFKDFLYIPQKSEVEFCTSSEAVVMQIGALTDQDTDFAHIKSEEVINNPHKHRVYGSNENNCLRDVYLYIDDGFKASRLLMGICEGRLGGWTAWPPHEHAEKREELYVYFNMGNAFAIQCIYEDLNSPIFCGIVRDGDMVSIPKGFHPNVGCPAGRISYIFAMASKIPEDRKFMDLNIQKEFGSKL
ncbi:MAG: 5-deoxy-glucuronate isomerase [Candidatus Bathyarchaeia archaeon]